jgi:glycosyltransferase involved in cell wall biosynthesis
MPYQGKKIIVVMPSYNASKTLLDCYHALPMSWIDEVVLVDDCSLDNTFEIAKTLPLHAFRHPVNRGYGGNQKTCYQKALNLGADVMIMVHPDHQYDPKFIPEMVRGIVDRGYLAVFGSRMMIRRNALTGGMPRWKYFFNIILTKIGNFILGTSLTEFHSGFRAYHKDVFHQIDITKNSDDFVFDTQIIIQLVDRHIPILEIPISTRYFPEASQISLWPSIRYGLSILFNLCVYKTKLRKFN